MVDLDSGVVRVDVITYWRIKYKNEDGNRVDRNLFVGLIRTSFCPTKTMKKRVLWCYCKVE